MLIFVKNNVGLPMALILNQNWTKNLYSPKPGKSFQ